MKASNCICVITILASLALAGADEPKKETKDEPKKAEPSPAAKEEKKTVNNNEVAVIKTTEGEMVAEFWPDVAPKTVENFKALAKKGFYEIGRAHV